MNELSQHPFKWRHFQSDIILLCVRWYIRYSLSYRDLEEMMAERGLCVDHTTIYRWVQRYAPELEKRCRPYLNATNDSWRVDETYIKVKKIWTYLYRAVDSEGNTLEFLLSSTRDAEAATRFFCKALHTSECLASQEYPVETEAAQPMVGFNTLASTLRVINVDKNAAYPKAIADLKAAGILPEAVELRQVKYLNNLIEQDHRFIKRLTKPGMGFFSFETAWRTLQGFEVMNMIRKGQVQEVTKGDVQGQVALVLTPTNWWMRPPWHPYDQRSDPIYSVHQFIEVSHCLSCIFCTYQRFNKLVDAINWVATLDDTHFGQSLFSICWSQWSHWSLSCLESLSKRNKQSHFTLIFSSFNFLQHNPLERAVDMIVVQHAPGMPIARFISMSTGTIWV